MPEYTRRRPVRRTAGRLDARDAERDDCDRESNEPLASGCVWSEHWDCSSDRPEKLRRRARNGLSRR
ncbi:hypothetical protein, partial [Bradyrhizobium brasilense]|uniref:hypothetical protein n=1 Tax=Bradyrhizobium brasilense TaxID=1419277 RepID=UPI001E313920